MDKASAILDWTGKPFKANGHSRQDLFQMAVAAPKPNGKKVRARYDAAQDTDEFANWWAAADHLDPDTANSRAVREKLVSRSRYEVENNGYMDGIVQTHANYLVGIGPSLRMQTGNEGFNSVIELIWYQWSKAIQLRRKLWCMAHAKVQDGQSFGIAVTNERVRHTIKLDLRLVETDQVQSTSYESFFDPNHVDGIILDDEGNPAFYEILPYHPAKGHFSLAAAEAERIDARYVMHWFTLRRPGQHHGVPEFRSTLNTGASSRRYREAVVRAAEVAAQLGAVLIQSGLSPNDVEQIAPLSTVELMKGMITALPSGWTANQMKPENPTMAYEGFIKAQIGESGRPKSMSRNLSMADSSDYNYASGRLDHQTYFSSLDVEREEGNDLVLDKLFDLWWEEAVREYGFPNFKKTPAHAWDWPKHPVADIKSEAAANDTRLKNGSLTLTRSFIDAGLDPEDECQREAEFFGKSVEEIKEAKFNLIYAPKAPAAGRPPLEQAIEDEERENANSAA